MTLSVVYDLMLVLAAGLVAAVVCRRLRLSVLIGYLIVGTLIGDGVLGWVRDREHQLEHFAEVGVFFLLFSIGLEFSLEDLRRLGRKLFVGGALQMSLVALPVAWVIWGSGGGGRAALLIGLAMAFSSTVLVFRSLNEVGQAQTPHGRRAIGILLFQDIALVPLLLLVPFLTFRDHAAIDAASPTVTAQVLQLVGVSVVFIAGVIGLRYVLAEYVIPRFAALRSTELVVLFTIVSLGGVTLAAYRLGLPPAIGALAAGLVFNGNRWSHQIDALVLPFRETFAAIFFIGLGLIFRPNILWEHPSVMLLWLPSLMVVKAIAGTIAFRATGLPTRSSMGMSLGLVQVGEFAFVLALVAMQSGVLSEATYQRIIAVAVGSLLLTPPLMRVGLRWVGQFADEAVGVEPASSQTAEHQAVVVGAGPIGRSIASQLETYGNDVCLVDLSPINLHSFAQEGFRTVAGDATDAEVLHRAGVEKSDLVVVCLPSDDAAVRVVRAIRRRSKRPRIIVRCRYQANIKRLLKNGAGQIVAEENEATLALMKMISKVQAERLLK